MSPDWCKKKKNSICLSCRRTKCGEDHWRGTTPGNLQLVSSPEGEERVTNVVCTIWCLAHLWNLRELELARCCHSNSIPVVGLKKRYTTTHNFVAKTKQTTKKAQRLYVGM